MGDTDKAITPRQPPWPAPLVAPLPPGRFAKNEEWAWARIANGLNADMAFYPGDAADPEGKNWLEGQSYARPDPKDASSFKPQHKLSELFLRTILFHEPWASAPEWPSVWISNALIDDAIDWSERETNGALWFFRCRFAQDVICRRLHVRGNLSLQACKLAGELNLDRAHIQSDLYCRGGFVAEKNFSLLGAHIGGNAEFDGAPLKGGLSADGLRVEGGVFSRNKFTVEKEVVLRGAHIGSNAEFDGATFKGEFAADGIRIEGNLFFRNEVVAEMDVHLRIAHIGGQADFTSATLKGRFTGEALQVDGDLFLRKMKRLGAASLAGARIGQDFQLRESHIDGEIDLTGAIIAGELHLDVNPSTQPNWGDSARLILRNASAASVAGRLDAFRRQRGSTRPKRGDFVNMDLTGFRYQRLGGLNAAHKNTMAAAEAAHLIAWLEAGCGDGAFNPDPYRQLARALKVTGDTGKALEILRAMAGHERRSAKGWRSVSFFFSWLFIDYGYSNLRALGWFLLLVLGYTAWGLNMEGLRSLDFSAAGFGEFFRWLGFSFANAVPLMSFDKAHETFLAAQFGHSNDPASVPVAIAWAYYLEKVAGFIILTYLAAGLSGLAHRRVEEG